MPAKYRSIFIRVVLSVSAAVLLVVAPTIFISTHASETNPRKLKQQTVKRAPVRQGPAKRSTAPFRIPGIQTETESESEFENVGARREWFLFKRTFPFDHIPENARRLAWERRPRERFTPNAAQAWSSIGPTPTQAYFPNNWGLTSGRINAVAISPANEQIILVGGATGGVWRSTDGGTNFVPTTDFHVDLAVGAIAFAPSNPSVVYAGMGDKDSTYLGSGVLKSTDAGATWKQISNSSLPSPGQIIQIAVDPGNSERVYAAQYARLNNGQLFSSGFHLSTDGGVNWQKTLTGLCSDLAISPTNGQTLYLGMRRVDENGMPAGLYKSTDAGLTWNNIYRSPFTSTYDLRVAVTPAGPQKIVVYTGGFTGSANNYRIEVSTDGGSTYTTVNASGKIDTGQFGYNTYFAVDPRNANTMYAGTRDVYKTTDNGTTWVSLTKNFSLAGNYNPPAFGATSHPDQHCFAFLPSNPQTFFIGNDGGLSKSTDGGATFQSLNRSLSLTMFVGYALHPTDATIAYGGTQDNGSQRRTSTPGQWQEFFGGDGGNCVINPLDTSTVFTTYVYGTIFRFRDGGNRFERQITSESTFGESSSNPRIAFYPPFTGNGVNQTLYFGTWRLFISKDLGNTWNAPAGTLDLTAGTSGGRDVLSAIGVSRSDSKVIYTGSARGRVMATSDEGATWRNITAGLPTRFISSITVHPTSPSTAYLTVQGFGSGHVFRTTDSGATWTNISGNLPDIPANALLIDPLNEQVLYVGTDIGVFRSTTGGTEWESFNRGMPPCVISAFGAQSSGKIHVATYGRGAFELVGAPDPDTTPPTVKVVSPNGGERFENGGKLSITWTATDNQAVDKQNVSLSINGGTSFDTSIASGLGGDLKAFEFVMPTTLTSQAARIRVTATDAEGNGAGDDSDANFVIVNAPPDTTPPTVKVISPNGGEATNAGKSLAVEWTATDNRAVSTQSIELSSNGGATFSPLASGLAGNLTSFSATIPATIETTRARIRVTAADAAGNTGNDVSDADFTVRAPDTVAPKVEVISPNGKEKMKVGSTFRIRWQSSDAAGIVSHDVLLSTDGGVNFPTILAAGLDGAAQSFDFTVPLTQAATKGGRIRVVTRDAAGNQGRDDSDANFRIKR